MKRFPVAALAVALTAAVACQAEPKADPAAKASADSQPGSNSAAQPGSQPTAQSGVSLAATTWRLVELGGEAIRPGAGGKELELSFSEDGKVSGFSGCNRFTGSFRADGGALTFSPIAATRMACMEGMDQEQKYLAALSAVRGYAVRGDDLVLSGEDGKALMRLASAFL